MRLGIVAHRPASKRVLTTFVLMLALAPPLRAQAPAPTSQVLTFSGTVPGQPDGPVAVRLRLYETNAGGTLQFEETQTVTVAAEKFLVRIGEATAGGVPATVFRSNTSLWIAFALDSTPDMEIGPRTAITSGGYAHTAALLSSPMVSTVNSLVGDITLAAGQNVTITPSGNTLTIDATTGQTGVTHNATLVGNGTSGSPLGVAAPLQLTNSSDVATISGTNSGTGAGVVGVGGSGTSSGVWGQSTSGYGVRGETGTGYGVIGSSSLGGFGVYGATNGGSTVAAVKGEAIAAGGNGVFGVASGAGGMGVWGNSASVSGYGVYGSNSGGGLAGYFNGKVQVNDTLIANGSVNSIGVIGNGDQGAGVIGFSTTSDGIYGFSHSGVGVHGGANTGYAGYFDGKVRVTSIPLQPSSAQVCFNAAGDLLQCGASSLRFKTNVESFREGLDVVQRLRPISFAWKDGGMHDIGLGAEDVAQVSPSLTITNASGDPEGVKYDRLSIVLINAVNEQQAQIQRQQAQIAAQQHELDELKALVCELRADADPCR